MGIVTTVSTVSWAYYEKRNRSVCELNIKQMSRALGKPEPTGLSDLSKQELIRMAMALHAEFPE